MLKRFVGFSIVIDRSGYISIIFTYLLGFVVGWVLFSWILFLPLFIEGVWSLCCWTDRKSVV